MTTDPLRNDLRLRLGAQLRSLRKRARLSGKALGDRAGVSQSKISRIEGGTLWPPLGDVEAILRALYVDQAEHDRVMALAEAIEHGLTTLRDLHRGSLEVRQLELLHLDADAAMVRQFDPSVLPAPFHTAAYARACTVAANLSGQRDVEAAVKARVARVAQLRGNDATPYHAVVTEAALRFVPAGVEHAMPDVWQSVLDSAAAMHVTVQVIPTGTPMSVLPTTGFTAFTFHAGRPPLVIVETVAAEVSFAGERETADVETVWQHLTEAALTPEDSQGFVRELAAAGL